MFLAQHYLTIFQQISLYLTKQHYLHLSVLMQNKVNLQVANAQDE